MTDYTRPDDPAVEFPLARLYRRFAMPAIYGLADGRQRVERINELDIFNNEIYVREVYLPILQELGVTRPEMRSYCPTRKSAPTNGAI